MNDPGIMLLDCLVNGSFNFLYEVSDVADVIVTKVDDKGNPRMISDELGGTITDSRRYLYNLLPNKKHRTRHGILNASTTVFEKGKTTSNIFLETFYIKVQSLLVQMYHGFNHQIQMVAQTIQTHK
jgi:hypothetical protein